MNTRVQRALLGLLLAVTTTAAMADTSPPVVESSALVEGNIVIAKDGSVQDVTVSNPENYGTPIVDLVRKAALHWRFQPVLHDGSPVLAKCSMHVRVVLGQQPDGNYVARIKGATFGDDNAHDTDSLSDMSQGKSFRPKYPREAVSSRVEGTVYLALRVDRRGHVTEAFTEQVNLRNKGERGAVERYRNVLAQSAITAVRHWLYTVPTTGKLAAQDSWTVRTSVAYQLLALGEQPHESVWQTYIPGPYTPAPWVDKPDADAADALADDSVQTDGTGPVLLTPISHG